MAAGSRGWTWNKAVGDMEIKACYVIAWELGGNFRCHKRMI